MGLQKHINYALLFAIAILFFAMFATITPCQSAPSIPNPTYTWTMCTLNPDLYFNNNLQFLYLGYTESLMQTYIMIFLGAFIISIILLQLITKQRRE